MSKMWRSGVHKQLGILVFAVAIVSSYACNQVENCIDCLKGDGFKRCTQCTSGYYIDSNDICSSCQSTCVTCVSWNNCSGCIAGKYGRWCSVHCDPNCIQTDCYQYNGTCVHGCHGGYYQAGPSCGKCSKYILNCEECSDHYHCTRCASGYNLWPAGGTTLCNVGCPPGTWGVQCLYNCSSNCSNTGCKVSNGTCHSCKRYTYGQTCQFQCSDGCNDDTGNNVCDKLTGECIYGCTPGYTGNTCETTTSQAVDGHWGQWSKYGPCSVTCGSGSKSRSRSCDNPAPQNGGQSCLGNNVETVDCNQASCPAGGQWSQWSSYGACSSTCGWGSRSRSRSCDQPAPQNGEQLCSGRDMETTDCYMISCIGKSIVGTHDSRSATDGNDSLVGVGVGGIFGGAVVGLVGGLLIGYCIFKKKCWRRGQKSGNRDNTCNQPSVAYVNITDTAGGVTVTGNGSGVPAYESLDRRPGPDTIYTELETRTS